MLVFELIKYIYKNVALNVYIKNERSKQISLFKQHSSDKSRKRTNKTQSKHSVRNRKITADKRLNYWEKKKKQ